MKQSFISKLLPAPIGGGFSMDDYWVWCGSVIQGEDGKYHMFASRWPKTLNFVPHWVSNSEVVRAVSDTPEGPYTFEEVVLPPRGVEYWDGRMTHNPTIHRCGDTYLLYYTGTTYAGDAPSMEDGMRSPKAMEARANQRIGLATAKSVRGPWIRQDRPILEPRPGEWDGLMTTNPAPCVLPDGSVLLVYKSTANQSDLLRQGVAKADHYEGPYVRLRNEPIFNFDATGDHVEDAYVWYANGKYELIMKDMRGGICGEKYAGIHATSDNGLDWIVSDPALAYSRTIQWDDGSITIASAFERPQLLIQDGQPTHLFAATCNGPTYGSGRTWNMVIPLRTSED
jgi:hypothetical protein